MPPRSVKKAVAKRPLPRSNKNLARPAPEEAAPLAAINESPSVEVADVKREEFKIETIATPMSVEDPMADEKTMASEIDGAMIVKEKPTRVLAEVSKIQEIASENVEEEASFEKAREETVADDPDDGKKVDDSNAPPEIAEVPRHPDDITAVTEAEEEYDVVDPDQGKAKIVEDDNEVANEENGDEIKDDEEDSIEDHEEGGDAIEDEDEDEDPSETEGSGKDEGDEEDGNEIEVEKLDDGYTNRNSDNVNEEENDEDDASLYIQAQMAVKKDKNFKIFIGGLDKSAVEEDIINVFGMFGEIQSIRIVKNPVTQKSKGFAFIQYANMDDARKVLAELKDGAEVKGKRVGISASQDNNTLYLGNICKTWTKEQVIETLRGYGVEHLEDVLLPEDPNKEGKTKGFAFLEFNSHSDAMEAFQRLRKPDAVFGCERSAKVAFAETSMNLSEEIMLQVKTVYIEDLPDSWDEKKIREICQHYGEIEKIQMFRKSATKKKDFAFVKFTSRESALACMEGMNNGQLGEGNDNVKVNLARPPKGRFAKRAARGGFKVNKDDDVIEQVHSKRKKKPKSKQVSLQGDAKGKKKKEESNFKSHGRSTKNRKQWQSDKRKKQSGGHRGIVVNERPSKKARRDYYHGDTHGRHSAAKHPYSKYSMPGTNYQRYAYAGASGSNPYQSDFAPHAGYLPASQGHHSYGYEQRFSAYDIQRGSEFTGAVSTTRPPYPRYSSSTGYQAGYTYPSSGAYPGRSNYAPHNYH